MPFGIFLAHGMATAYNAIISFVHKHQPRYTPLVKLPDSAIKAIGAKPTAATQQFLRQGEDRTTRHMDVETIVAE